MSQGFRDPDAVISVLNEIATLYCLFDEEARADTLREISGKVKSDPQAAIEFLTGVEVWGGSGSMVDLCFDPAFEQFRTANRHHAKLLFDLMRELERSGLHSPWFKSRREVLLRDMSW